MTRSEEMTRSVGYAIDPLPAGSQTQQVPPRLRASHETTVLVSLEVMGVPLSEDEQRILSEIESHLYEDDPELAREVAETTVYTHSLRNIKWAALGLAVGVVIMVGMLAISYLLSFAGFLVMLGSLLFLERNARKLGKAGLGQVTQSMRSGGLRGVVGGAGARMRQRFERDGRSDK